MGFTEGSDGADATDGVTSNDAIEGRAPTRGDREPPTAQGFALGLLFLAFLRVPLTFFAVGSFS